MNRRARLLLFLRGHLRGTWMVALAAITLLMAGLHIAEARQNGQAVPVPQAPPAQDLNARAGVQYLGDEACRKCLSSIYADFRRTGMGRSVSVPSAEDVRDLAKPVKIIDKKLNRTYSIYARDGKIFHEESESDAK